MEDTNQILKEVNTSLGQLQKEYPEYMQSFGMFMRKAEGPGALPTKTKELISVALSVQAKCKWCIAYHVRMALDAGATREEIMEASFVAVAMGRSCADEHTACGEGSRRLWEKIGEAVFYFPFSNILRG